jgi:CheY-like chemotaxis protein
MEVKSDPASKRILVLDDDQDSREVFAEFLRMSGFEVDEFETAEEALASLDTGLPAVMVMDITLSGGMNGYEAAQHIRALPAAQGIKLVAMTGHSSASLKKDGDLFDSILTKPVDADALIKLVRQLTS